MNVALNILNVGPSQKSGPAKSSTDEQPNFDLSFADSETDAQILEALTAGIAEEANPEISTVTLPDTEIITTAGSETEVPGEINLFVINDTDIEIPSFRAALPEDALIQQSAIQPLANVDVDTVIPALARDGQITAQTESLAVPTASLIGLQANETDINISGKIETAAPAVVNADAKFNGIPVSEVLTVVAANTNAELEVDPRLAQDSLPAAVNVSGTNAPVLAANHLDRAAPRTTQNAADIATTATVKSAEDVIERIPLEFADPAVKKTVNPVQIEIPRIVAEPGLPVAATLTASPDNVTRVQQSITLASLPPQAHPALQQVAETLIRAQLNQTGLSIRLDPPELGNVSIQFQFDAERNVTAIVRADVPDTSALLRDKAEVLIQALKDNGFNSVNLSFEQGENQSENPFDADNMDDNYSVISADKIVNEKSIPVLAGNRLLQYSDGVNVDMKL